MPVLHMLHCPVCCCSLPGSNPQLRLQKLLGSALPNHAREITQNESLSRIGKGRNTSVYNALREDRGKHKSSALKMLTIELSKKLDVLQQSQHYTFATLCEVVSEALRHCQPVDTRAQKACEDYANVLQELGAQPQAADHTIAFQPSSAGCTALARGSQMVSHYMEAATNAVMAPITALDSQHVLAYVQHAASNAAPVQAPSPTEVHQQAESLRQRLSQLEVLLAQACGGLSLLPPAAAAVDQQRISPVIGQLHLAVDAAFGQLQELLTAPEHEDLYAPEEVFMGDTTP